MSLYPLADPAVPSDALRMGGGRRLPRLLVGLWNRVGPTHALEGVLIFAVLLVVEWVTPGRATLASVSPHPFWIPVILMSVQKGA